jgi:transcriptional antiterminator Rof (Rho-off)
MAEYYISINCDQYDNADIICVLLRLLQKCVNGNFRNAMAKRRLQCGA